MREWVMIMMMVWKNAIFHNLHHFEIFFKLDVSYQYKVDDQFVNTTTSKSHYVRKCWLQNTAYSTGSASRWPGQHTDRQMQHRGRSNAMLAKCQATGPDLTKLSVALLQPRKQKSHFCMPLGSSMKTVALQQMNGEFLASSVICRSLWDTTSCTLYT